MIRHAGETDRAQQNGVAVRQYLQTVGRHHPPCSEVIFAAPFQILKIKGNAAVFPGQRLKHSDGLMDHINADPVAGDQLNRKFFHRAKHLSDSF